MDYRRLRQFPCQRGGGVQHLMLHSRGFTTPAHHPATELSTLQDAKDPRQRRRVHLSVDNIPRVAHRRNLDPARWRWFDIVRAPVAPLTEARLKARRREQNTRIERRLQFGRLWFSREIPKPEQMPISAPVVSHRQLVPRDVERCALPSVRGLHLSMSRGCPLGAKLPMS